MNLKRIIIAGEGGQGIQSLAYILTRCAFSQKLSVSYLPNFGVEQRGGVSLAYIQISSDAISFPKFTKADILVLLAPRAEKRIEMYLKKDTVLIFDNSLISENAISHFRVEKVAIPASVYAKEHLIPRVFNMIMLGALAAEIDRLKIKKLEKEIIDYFVEKFEKAPQLKHFNLSAVNYGYDMVKKLRKEQKWRQKNLLK